MLAKRVSGKVGDRDTRRRLISLKSKVSISKQCEILGLSRTDYYYEPKGESAENLEIMAGMDKSISACRGLHNTLDASGCINVLNEAVGRHGAPEIINSDQGCQFTCKEWTEACARYPQMKVSMDGRGRAKDNIWFERFWRTIKYEYIYIAVEESGAGLYQGIGRTIPSKLYIRSAAWA